MTFYIDKLWKKLMLLCRACAAPVCRLLRFELTDERWHICEQFIKFLFVGLSNTVVLLLVYYAVLLGLGERYYLLGQTLGYALGIVNSFFWNSRYVFRGRRNSRAHAFIRMCVCYGLTYVLQMLLLYLLVDIILWPAAVAPVIVVIITTPVNFVLNKLFAFRESPG